MSTQQFKTGDRLSVSRLAGSPFIVRAQGGIVTLEEHQGWPGRFDYVCEDQLSHGVVALTQDTIKARIAAGYCTRLETGTPDPPLKITCGCGKHDIDPTGDRYIQHNLWLANRKPLEGTTRIEWAKPVGVSAKPTQSTVLVEDQYEV